MWIGRKWNYDIESLGLSNETNEIYLTFIDVELRGELKKKKKVKYVIKLKIQQVKIGNVEIIFFLFYKFFFSFFNVHVQFSLCLSRYTVQFISTLTHVGIKQKKSKKKKFMTWLYAHQHPIKFVYNFFF